MSNSKLKLTFIIPAYNVEPYIEQCLDSLLMQTVQSHRVIIVDDASTDETANIAERYQKKHPEMFRVFRQKCNLGQGAARNRALQYVDTEYLTFLDSDDWLMPRFVEIVLKRLAAEEERPEIIFTLPRVFDMATQMNREWMDTALFHAVFPSLATVVNPDNDIRIYDLEVSACRKVYLATFWKKYGFKFPEGVKWEDVPPHFLSLHEAKRCIGEPRVGFYYRVNNASQTTSSTGKNRIQTVSVFADLLRQALVSGWKNEELFRIMHLSLVFFKWSMDCISVKYRKDLINRIHQFYRCIPKKFLQDYFVSCYVTSRDKLWIKILRSMFYIIFADPFTYKNAKKVLSKVYSKRK